MRGILATDQLLMRKMHPIILRLPVIALFYWRFSMNSNVRTSSRKNCLLLLTVFSLRTRFRQMPQMKSIVNSSLAPMVLPLKVIILQLSADGMISFSKPKRRYKVGTDKCRMDHLPLPVTMSGYSISVIFWGGAIVNLEL